MKASLLQSSNQRKPCTKITSLLLRKPILNRSPFRVSASPSNSTNTHIRLKNQESDPLLFVGQSAIAGQSHFVRPVFASQRPVPTSSGIRAVIRRPYKSKNLFTEKINRERVCRDVRCAYEKARNSHAPRINIPTRR